MRLPSNLFNYCCVHCDKPLAIAHHGLCSHCNRQIRRYPYCGRCGTELPSDQLFCGRCLQIKPLWNKIVIIGRYSEPLSDLIHRFKFKNQYFLDRTLARLLLLAIRNAKRTHQLTLPDVILPVPLHHWRQWQRGYNQSNLLANWLYHWLAISVRQDLIQRCKHTATQRGLSAVRRRKNLKGAFRVSASIKKYQSVALVDDVITTGSTLNEITKQLRKQGVKHIQVWGLART